MLAGLASAMYYYQDEERGVFLRLSSKKRRFLPLLCHLCALLPFALAVLLALRAANLLTGWAREIGLVLLYCAAIAAFCELLRKLCRSETRLGALLPALLAAMLALCPVFLDWKAMEPVGRLFPPYYYLKGIYSGRYVWQLLGYTVAVGALAVLLPEKNQS